MPMSLSRKEERAQLCLPSFMVLAAPCCGITHAKATGRLGSLHPARQGAGPGCYKSGLSKLQPDPGSVRHPGLPDHQDRQTPGLSGTRGCWAPGAAGSSGQPDPRAVRYPGLLGTQGCWASEAARPLGQPDPGALDTQSRRTPELPHPGKARPRGCRTPRTPGALGLPNHHGRRTPGLPDPGAAGPRGHPNPAGTGLPGLPGTWELPDPRAELEARTSQPSAPAWETLRRFRGAAYPVETPGTVGAVGAALPRGRGGGGPRPPEPGPPSGEPMRNFLAGGGAPPAAAERGAGEAAAAAERSHCGFRPPSSSQGRAGTGHGGAGEGGRGGGRAPGPVWDGPGQAGPRRSDGHGGPWVATAPPRPSRSRGAAAAAAAAAEPRSRAGAEPPRQERLQGRRVGAAGRAGVEGRDGTPDPRFGGRGAVGCGGAGAGGAGTRRSPSPGRPRRWAPSKTKSVLCGLLSARVLPGMEATGKRVFNRGFYSIHHRRSKNSQAAPAWSCLCRRYGAERGMLLLGAAGDRDGAGLGGRRLAARMELNRVAGGWWHFSGEGPIQPARPLARTVTTLSSPPSATALPFPCSVGLGEFWGSRDEPGGTRAHPCRLSICPAVCEGNFTCKENEVCVRPSECRCRHGYFGANCDTKCPRQFWGPDCKEMCSCHPNGQCEDVTGQCTCNPNRWGPKCENVCLCKHGKCDQKTGKCTCEPNWWGPQCSSSCYCSHNSQCDQQTGNCLCQPGWWGRGCNNQCSCNNSPCEQFTGRCQCRERTFGPRCDRYCQCYKGKCNQVDGTCTCEPGYRGKYCREPCPAGFYGQGCRRRCGQCKSLQPCTVADGRCLTCEAGWNGTKCDQPCSPGFYGEGCEKLCPPCKDGHTCNHINGKCSHCNPGWIGDRCETKCRNGTYGENCAFVCSDCVNGQCHFETGRCLCHPGSHGTYCNLTCPPGRYGANCAEACSCHDGACDPLTGACHMEANQRMGVIGAGALLALLLILLLSLLCCCCVCRKKDEARGSSQDPAAAKKPPRRLCGRFSRIGMKLPRIPLRRQKLPKVVALAGRPEQPHPGMQQLGVRPNPPPRAGGGRRRPPSRHAMPELQHQSGGDDSSPHEARQSPAPEQAAATAGRLLAPGGFSPLGSSVTMVTTSEHKPTRDRTSPVAHHDLENTLNCSFIEPPSVVEQPSPSWSSRGSFSSFDTTDEGPVYCVPHEGEQEPDFGTITRGHLLLSGEVSPLAVGTVSPWLLVLWEGMQVLMLPPVRFQSSLLQCLLLQLCCKSLFVLGSLTGRRGRGDLGTHRGAGRNRVGCHPTVLQEHLGPSPPGAHPRLTAPCSPPTESVGDSRGTPASPGDKLVAPAGGEEAGEYTFLKETGSVRAFPADSSETPLLKSSDSERSSCGSGSASAALYARVARLSKQSKEEEDAVMESRSPGKPPSPERTKPRPPDPATKPKVSWIHGRYNSSQSNSLPAPSRSPERAAAQSGSPEQGQGLAKRKRSPSETSAGVQGRAEEKGSARGKEKAQKQPKEPGVPEGKTSLAGEPQSPSKPKQRSKAGSEPTESINGAVQNAFRKMGAFQPERRVGDNRDAPRSPGASKPRSEPLHPHLASELAAQLKEKTQSLNKGDGGTRANGVGAQREKPTPPQKAKRSAAAGSQKTSKPLLPTSPHLQKLIPGAAEPVAGEPKRVEKPSAGIGPDQALPNEQVTKKTPIKKPPRKKSREASLEQPRAAAVPAQAVQ
ncbi:hypothetical protein QYF61_013108 [Mycteria americana]|uniref:EGF-like domain-containing protein n=1 Tax=Mycteria americana TaxID=33587 RepID=A0AAN7NLK1_MYCAM|nr:hypothetical protein QYF61_013108 [Mycteria americana]